jgi:hypothetical protein
MKGVEEFCVINILILFIFDLRGLLEDNDEWRVAL